MRGSQPSGGWPPTKTEFNGDRRIVGPTSGRCRGGPGTSPEAASALPSPRAGAVSLPAIAGWWLTSAARRGLIDLPSRPRAVGEGKVMQNLLLGVGIGLFGTLAVLTARYVAAVLAG
jgi:hypothetical protein